jgi:RNA polymerase sigma-70 factor, ECF subfamily
MNTPERERELGGLASRAVNGDKAAMEALLSRLRPLIVRYCRARLGAHDGGYGSADDVAQEVCLAVLTSLPKYVDRGKPFVAFAYGIAAHKVADAYRASSRVKSEPVGEFPDAVDTGDGPEELALAGDRSQRMNQLLECLPEAQREVVILRVAVGMSADEVAEVLGMSPGAVRVSQHRALGRLRQVVARSPEVVV